MAEQSTANTPIRLRPRVYRAARVFWHRYWWIALTAVACVAFALAFWGSEEDSVVEQALAAIRVFPLGVAPPRGEPLAVQIAHPLAWLVVAFATIRAALGLFRTRFHEFRASRAKEHVIVCGLGEKGRALTESLVRKAKVVAVELDLGDSAIQRLRDHGAIVLQGDALDPERLRSAGLARARCVVAVCGSDAANAQIAANVLQFAERGHASPPHTSVHVADPRLYTFLLRHALSSKRARLEFFNTYERGARSFLHEILQQHRDSQAAVLVVGAGELGLAVLSLLARDRFEHQAEHPGAEKLRAHVVDEAADSRVQLLRDRYSRFDDACILIPHNLDVTSPAFDGILESDPELAEIQAAFVCFDDDNLTVATTLNLLEQGRSRFPVVARVSRRSAGIAAMLESVPSGSPGPTSFRALSLAESCRGDVVLQGIRGELARYTHEAYRAGAPGGPYDVPWDELTDEGRDRNLKHADAIASQLEAVGYRLGPLLDWGEPLTVLGLAEIEAMSEMEHERWMEERLQGDWRYGPERDDEARLHPDLVPWSQLPRDRQDINRRLVSERPAMLAHIAVQIYRS